MLTTLRLGNFKAFADVQKMQIRPLTLIFGVNSSGKSSLIHGLLLAQHAQKEGELDVHRTVIGGDCVDLGGFRQYVHRRDASRRVEWSAEMNPAQLHGRLAELLAPVHRLSVRLTIGITLDDRGEPLVDAIPQVMSYELEADDESLLRMSRRRDDRLQLDRLEHEHPVFRGVIKAIVATSTTTEALTPADYEGIDEAIAEIVPKMTAHAKDFLPTGLSRTDIPTAEDKPAILFPISRGNRKEELSNLVHLFLPRILDELIEGVYQALSGELARLRYLGPLRSYPPRHLAFSQHHDPNWSAGGGYAWDVVRRDEKVRAAVNAWLGSPSRLQTPYELVVHKYAEQETIREAIESLYESFSYDVEMSSLVHNYKVWGNIDARKLATEFVGKVQADYLEELVMIDTRTNTVVSHRDVGIGISQVLPVLVSAYGSQNQIVAIEQPEIHLHPGLQAELGDVFIEAALGERRNTFILETHSEHLILRLLRRIRETTDGELPEGLPRITPEDIAIIYVKPTEKGAKVIEIPTTEDGDLATDWPDGFFTEIEEELF